MYFKRLEMHGFKSFADPVVIEFHEGITCIVGPNGSGKSNISDAIRWVLGEQSPKALRGGKMEEVIFAGTANRKSRGMAEVTLVIDNSTGILNIDYNEVAITRRMYRSGESEYLINSNHCRLRDIRELIMDTGIGVDGYSLIGQGKIADIVSNKPESRREIFEEAAGIVMYKNKKAEAERKLESTAGNLDRVNDIICEIESRIDKLKDDSQKAEEYLKLREKYTNLEINITLNNIDNVESKIKVFRNDIENLSKNISDLTESKEKTDREADEARERNNTLETLGNQARDRLLAFVEEINTLTGQSDVRAERLSGISKDKTRLSSEIDDLTEKLESEERNRDELRKSEKEIFVNHNKAKNELAEKINNHSEILRQATECSENIDKARESLFDAHNYISTSKSEIKSYDSIREALEKRKNQLSLESEDEGQSKKSDAEALENAEAQRDKVKDSIEKLSNQISSIDSQKKKIEDELKQLKAQAEELKINTGHKLSRKRTIEEMESNYEGYNYAARFIMKSGLPGIEGVVADVVTVPEGYEAAIETALGGQLQNIICSSDSDAKKAVNALKQNRAGRLTFLPVSSVRGQKAKVPPEISGDLGFIGIASECISFDGRYTGIFDYLLGRVAIVDNMDTAVALSKVRNAGLRFVTLDGEIINVSGAITGGKYKNKTANILERKGEITKLAAEIEEADGKLSELRETYREREKVLSDLDSEYGICISDRREKEEELGNISSRIAILKEKIFMADSREEKTSRELLSIETELDSAEKSVEETREKVMKAEGNINELNAELENLMASYEVLREKTEHANEEITATRIAVNSWEQKKTSIITLIGRIGKTCDQYKEELAAKYEETESLEKEESEIISLSGSSAESIEQLVAQKEDTEKYIAEVTEEKKKLSAKMAEVSEIQQDTDRRLTSFKDQKYNLEIKLAKNETQMEGYKEHLWDEFEVSYAQAADMRDEDFVMSKSVKESREIKSRIRELGEVNVGAIEEYRTVSERYSFLTEQREDITTARDELLGIISDMDKTIKTRFKENFDSVAEKFESIFRELFGGGHAQLSIDDTENPLEAGIDIIAQPPGKKLQNINLMSGGEKTMTAIALMFAVLKTKPTPFCILDEVEAALDDANIERFAKYLKNFDNVQFALVTHQKVTMEHADVLYGVTMAEHGVSKVLSLKLGDDFDL